MRRIGLIGGISWGATAEYYRLINLEVKQRLGGHHSADMLIRSLDLHPLLERAEDVKRLERVIRQAADDACKAGAELLAVASFTGHRYVGGLAHVGAPVVDLVDALAVHLKSSGIKSLAVWATSIALQDAELLGRLQRGIAAQLMPVPEDARSELDRIIFSELADRQLGAASVAWLHDLLGRQMRAGAEAILLATTDLSPVRAHLAVRIPMLDATEIHCAALVNAALAETAKELQ